jgi:hypothetical protein
VLAALGLALIQWVDSWTSVEGYLGTLRTATHGSTYARSELLVAAHTQRCRPNFAKLFSLFPFLQLTRSTTPAFRCLFSHSTAGEERLSLGCSNQMGGRANCRLVSTVMDSQPDMTVRRVDICILKSAKFLIARCHACGQSASLSTS